MISRKIGKRLHELEAQLEETDKNLLIEKSKIIYTFSKAEIKEYYMRALKLEPLMLINYLIDKILLYYDRVEIKYKTPLTIDPDDSIPAEGFNIRFYRVLKT